MSEHETIDYVEYPAADLAATKRFFEAVFGWKFTDFGDDYSAFSRSDAGLNGGFYTTEGSACSAEAGALIVFYSRDLEATRQKITSAGGCIVKPVFEFPGGRRFHFTEPSGNEMAVWSDDKR